MLNVVWVICYLNQMYNNNPMPREQVPFVKWHSQGGRVVELGSNSPPNRKVVIIIVFFFYYKQISVTLSLFSTKTHPGTTFHLTKLEFCLRYYFAYRTHARYYSGEHFWREDSLNNNRIAWKISIFLGRKWNRSTYPRPLLCPISASQTK